MNRVHRGGVQRFLKVHAKVDVVEEKLQRPLVLSVTTGGAEDHVRVAVLGDQ